MDRQDKEQIAQEKYGKGYDDLSTNEQKAVGGVYGGLHNQVNQHQYKEQDSDAVVQDESVMNQPDTTYEPPEGEEEADDEDVELEPEEERQ